MFKKVLLFVLCFSLFSPLAFSEEKAAGDAGSDYMYYLLEPDIITNYIKPGKRIGFIRVTVELMVKSKENYEILHHNEALIRDKVITVFGEQNEKTIKSITDRDSIREDCLDAVNAVLFAEIKKNPVEDILFTKYLYD